MTAAKNAPLIPGGLVEGFGSCMVHVLLTCDGNDG
jgi:hypothetical protein